MNTITYLIKPKMKRNNISNSHIEELCITAKNELKTVLGDDAEKIVRFYSAIRNTKCHYIIVQSRRCMVLFKYLFDKLEPDTDISLTNIISDRAIYDYSKFKNKKVIIVDDIMIHGRAIRQLYNNVAKYTKNVRVFVYYASIEAMNRVEIPTKFIQTGNETDMRILSNNIVDFIENNSIPYVSFLPAFYMKHNRDLIDRLKERYFSKLSEKKMYSMICSGGDALGELATICEGYYARLYFNQNENEMTFIPYLVINKIDKQAFDLARRTLRKTLKNKESVILELLEYKVKNSNDEENCKLFKARLISLLFNYIVTKKFFDYIEKSFSLEIQYRIDSNLLQMNFSDEILKEIEAIDYSAIDIDFDKENFCFKNEQEAYIPKVKDIVKERFWKDEIRASKNIGKEKGIKIQDIVKNSPEIYFEILGLMDCGRATGNYEIDDDDNEDVFWDVLLPGEQAYRLFVEDNPKFVLQLYYLCLSLVYVFHNQAFIDESIYEFFSKEIDLLDQFFQIVKKYKYNISSWIIPELIKDISYDERVELQIQVDNFIKRKKENSNN